MILTGKCKEDFLTFYWSNYIGKTRFISEKENTEDFFKTLYPILKNALIIEFFDSIKCAGFKSLWSYCFGNYDVFKDNWNEHIEQAIIKANEIYNERKI